MRKVSKAKAAALDAERSSGPSPKRNSSKASDAESDANDDQAEKMEDSDASEAYEVELILGSRVRHGKQQFKIRWKGFGPADDTWEDEENIDSPDLIAAFMKGSDNEGKGPKTSKQTTPKQATPKQAKGGKKQGKKRSSSSTPKESPKKQKGENGADGNTEWEVSKIIEYVELKDGTRQFLVRWKGFSAKEDTWEPESNLNCPDLIQAFVAKEQQRDEVTREVREVRKQVFKYNPELSKRTSHRFRSKSRISYHDLE